MGIFSDFFDNVSGWADDVTGWFDGGSTDANTGGDPLNPDLGTEGGSGPTDLGGGGTTSGSGGTGGGGAGAAAGILGSVGSAALKTVGSAGTNPIQKVANTTPHFLNIPINNKISPGQAQKAATVDPNQVYNQWQNRLGYFVGRK